MTSPPGESPDLREPHLAELHRTVAASMARVREEFAGLSREQLTWLPHPGSWGVGQCLDHLVVTDRLYLEEFGKALEKGRRKGLSRSGPFRGGRFGGWFARVVGPDGNMKMNVPKVFTPHDIEDTPDDVVERFLDTQAALLGSLEDADGLDLDRLKVRSPVTPLMWFRIGDAYRIVVEHDRRHLNQACGVKGAPGFPEGGGS